MGQGRRNAGQWLGVVWVYLSTIFSPRNVASALALFTAYTFTAYLILPGGVSKLFSHWAYQIALVLFIVVGLAAAFRGAKGKPSRVSGAAADSFTIDALAILLLPLLPIARYVLLNQDTLSLQDSIAFVAFCSLTAVLLILVVPYLLKRIIEPAVSIVLGAALLHTYFNMPVLASEMSWFNSGDLPVQIGVFVAVFVALNLLYPTRRAFLYPVLVVYFLLSTLLVPFLGGAAAGRGGSTNAAFPAEATLSDDSLETKPDIYLLTFDGYVGSGTLSQVGIDNSEQESFLRANGFKIYEGAYTLSGGSVASMAQVLNMTSLAEIEDARRVTAGDSSVVRILRSNGYRTFAVAGTFPYGTHQPYYDETNVSANVESQWSVLIRAVAEGQFRFNIDEFDRDELILARREVVRREAESPTFLYSHAGPYHTQNSGACLPDEVELYRERLAAANAEMIDDVEAIAETGREAIVIIHGDHGPYLTGDCFRMSGYEMEDITRLHVQDRLGVFLAIKWPTNCDCDLYDDIRTIQDVFPAVLAGLSSDPAILNHRIEPVSEDHVRGVYVDDGVIVGGRDDGAPLFLVENP